MSRSLAEILLFVSVAMNAALLTFIAGVLGSVMNDMREPAFKEFLTSFVRHSSKSPFMLTVLNIPFFGALPYLYYYGLHQRWIVAGLALWLMAGIVSKILKLPIYKSVAALDDGAAARLKTERRKLNRYNLMQAVLNLVASVLMAVAFIGS